MRIVSLVPSLTHMVCDFGLREALVGCTSFCIEPPGLARSVALIGGTKDPDMEKIRALRPTHILVNEEENKPEHIAECQALAATFVSFPKDPREVPALLRETGTWLGVTDAGERSAQALEGALAGLQATVARRRAEGAWPTRRYLYFIWREPYMLAARDTYISAMLDLVGFENVAPVGVRYPALTVPELRACGADLLLLSSEPYPFRVRDAERLRGEWPEAPEMLKVDGQLMSWYGTMATTAMAYLRDWTEGARHPERSEGSR